MTGSLFYLGTLHCRSRTDGGPGHAPGYTCVVVGITVEYWGSDTGQVCSCGPLMQRSTHNTLQLVIGAGIDNKPYCAGWVGIGNGGEGGLTDCTPY